GRPFPASALARRPYSLAAVPKARAAPQHYVFSPFGVLHVQRGQGAEALALGAWHREAVLWGLLRSIPVFRHCLLRAAFARWRARLLQAVPHFGTALLHISRLLQELRSVHWLPQDDTRSFSFPELQRALAQEKSRARGLLAHCLALCTTILELVRNDTYRMAQGLQGGTQVCGHPQAGGSAHQQRLQSEGMQRWHRAAERWLGQLGSLARLVNLLVAQSLVSMVQDQVTAFIGRVMQVRGHWPGSPWLGLWGWPCPALTAPLPSQADGAGREAVLRVQLVFDADNWLVSFPSRQALEDSLLGALDAVLESVLEVCQTRKELPGSVAESSASEAGTAPGLDPLTASTPVPAPSRSRGATPVPAACGRGGSHCPPCAALWAAGKGSMGTPVELLPSLWDEALGTQERAPRQPLAGLEVTGRRARSHYPEPAWEQLEQDLRTDGCIQAARATQQAQLAAALDETQELCREHAWVAEVHAFVQGWSPAALEVMRGQAPSTYAEHVAQLRAWAQRLQDLPPAVVTRNRLFLVDCSSLQQETAPLVACITAELQALALHEASLRSKVLITELSTVLKLYRSVGSDILTVAKCSHKLQQYQGQMGELQERVEYVRSLNDVIRHCFRPLAPDEESQENALLDTWEAFVFQQQEASDFITLRRLSIVDELEESLQRARQELHDLLAAATTGRFRDPASNARAAEQDLRTLLLRFQATAARLDELCHSQKTLTGTAVLPRRVRAPQPCLPGAAPTWRAGLPNECLPAPAGACMDQAFVATGQDLMEAHERLWRLFRAVTEQLSEWRCLAFAKFSAALALERAGEWQREAARLEERLPDAHPVLQACARAVSAFQQVLPLLQALGSPLLTVACWREIFAGHTMDTLRRLQKTWAEKQLRVVNFILRVAYQAPEHAHRPREPARVDHVPKDSGTFVLSGEQGQPGVGGRGQYPPARATPPPAPPPEAAGLVGACGETVLLRPPLPLQGQKPAQWLQALERGMKAALFQLLQGCVVQRLALRAQLDVPFEQLPGPTQLPLHLLAEHWGRLAGAFPAQCVLLAEEAVWRTDVEDQLLGPSPRTRPLKLRLKLEALAHYARSARASQAQRSGGAQLCTVLGALLTTTMHHRDVLARLLERRAASPAVFEWAQLLKYRVALPPAQAPGPAWAGEAPGCWAEVLDQRLHYDYEYVGPVARPVGGPQLERGFLGLLLALDEFRCAAALGGLARALGRQLVTLPCSRQLGLDCLRRFVSGAVQAGAWLLLEELDQLAPGVLVGFGQLTADLQALCVVLREGPCSGEEDEDWEEEVEEEEEKEDTSAGDAPALPELGVDEAQPFQPRILGHILFGDRLLRVRETFGCLATLRQVPATPRLALRPVALLPPDMQTVAELALLAAGFREASRLAHKLAAFFRLEGELGPGPGPGRLSLLKGVVQTATSILHPPVPPGTSCAQLSALAGLSEEPALVQALCLSPLLAGPEGPRLAQLRELLRSVFPVAGATLPECQAPAPVMRAVLAELQADGLHADLNLASAVGQLHQALQGSASVLLVGPVGSGKTTAWRTLAKALSRLATSEALEVPSGDSRLHGREDVALLPVSATCLCPNALSAPEFLGSMDGSVWTDGIFSRLMQRARHCSSVLHGHALPCRPTAGGVPETAAFARILRAQLDRHLPPEHRLATSEALEVPSGDSRLHGREDVALLPVSATCLCPNALSAPEFLGSMDGSVWTDGIFSRLMQRAVASGLAPSSQQWLVVDGAASPEWLEPIATLLGPEPALVLPSGQRIQAPEGVKLLLELLRGLAEELFPPTLAFLQRHCSSVLHGHALPCRPTAGGVPETAAFARILRAQLDRHLPPEQSPGQAPSTDEVAGPRDSSPTLAPSSSSSSSQHPDQLVAAQCHQLLLSIFVFAYIWGFGGHLHPRHWDAFDRFARRALLSSRCSVELPPAASVFDIYPQPESGRLEVFNGSYLCHRPKGVPATFNPLPQHERLLYVVDVLLGARQPVLLAGEPGAGKSALAELLAQPHQSWQRMSLSPPVGATHLRQLLQTRVPSSSRAPGLRAPSLHGTRGHLLVLEDLHAAEPGPGGGSCAVLETLRQALSHREVCSAETLELQRLLPGRCLATVSAPAPGAPPLCPRLARLFSTLALPTLTRDALVTMHTPALLAWLERLPQVPRASELAPALVGATVDAYEAVRARFRPVPARCPCLFSAHHVDRVLRGLLLLRPSPSPPLPGPADEGRAARRGSTGLAASPTLGAHTVLRLWLHEAVRTFCDPLASAPEQRECAQLLLDTALGAFCAHRSDLQALSNSEQGPGARPAAPTDEEDEEDDAPSDSDAEPDDTPKPETKEPAAMPRLQAPSRLRVASWLACPWLLLRCRSTEPLVASSMRRHSRRRSSEALARQPPCTPVPASLRALETSVSRVATGAALIHVSARCHAAYLAPRLPLVTPTTFLDLLDAFLTLSTQLQTQTQAQVDRLRAVLDKLQEVSERQQARGQDVRMLQEKLRKAKEKVVRCRHRAEQEEAVRRQQEQDCEQRQARLEDLAAEHSRLEQAQEEALEKMGADYEAALARLHVGDVEELRSYRRPPVPVVRVTDLLCRMFQQTPGWDSARQLLGRPDFYQELLFYPKDELSEEVQVALGHAAADAAFLGPVLRSASRAAAALGQWMCAVQRYGQAQRAWQPVLQQLARCEQQIREEEEQLSTRRLQAERLRERSAAWALKLEEVLEQQEALAQQLRCAQQDQAEGDSVGCTMAAHVARWQEATQALEQMCSTVQGDALLCAAAVCYLGAFPPPRRQELLEKWQDLLAGRRVPLGPDDVRRALEQELPCPGPAPTASGPPLLPVHPGFSLLALLSCEREQHAWDRDRKSRDPASRQAAALLHAAARICPRRWPLLLDPDQQALTWLSSVPRAKDDEACANPDMRPETTEPSSAAAPPEQTLQVLSAMDPGLEESLRAAAGSGLPVLLLHAEKSPGSPILRCLLQKEAGAGTEPAPGKAVQTLPSFRLYLSTSLPLHTLGQEMEQALLPSLNVVDLSLGEGALEELLLEELLLVERHEAQSHWRRLELSILQVEDELACAEEELIQLISAPEQALLETEAFLPMVHLLDTQVETLRSSHEHLCSLRQGHCAIREQYRPVARLGAALHQALHQVCRLHPLYCCRATASLAAAHRGLLVTRWGGARQQEALEARVMELRRALAQALLTYAQPGLWERHELLLALLGAVALQRLDGHVSPLAWLAFCQGLQAPTAARLLPLPPGAPPCPPGVDAKAWEECGRLEALPGFQGLQAALAGKAAMWQEYLHLPCTMVGPAPGPGHAGLGPFQRALLWRVLRPGQLCSVAADLAACLMGRPMAEAAAHSAAALYDHSQSHVPILFLTPLPGAAAATTHPLHWIQQMARQQHREGKVMVVTLGAPNCLQRMSEALGTCARRGHWLVLDNCHLQTHWPPDMLVPLQRLLGVSQDPAKPAAAATKGKKLHPKFRLWLIADARLPCPLPGPLRQSMVTVCCETPMDLPGALLRIYSLAQDQQAWRVQPERGLPLLALHAALLHRQHYGHRAQAAHYLWTEAELFAGLRAQERLSQVVSNPEEALQELAGSIFYGGHILDAGDAAVVQTLSQQCLSQDPHLPAARGVQSLCAALAGPTALGGSSEAQPEEPQAQMQQLVGAAAPALCGLPDGLQEQELERRSHALLADLLRSQALWLPHPRLPPPRQHESLGPLVQQGLEMVQELEAALQQCRPCGPQCPPPRPLLRFLLDEAGNLAALLHQVGVDLRCTQQQLQGMLCTAPRCATVLQALGRDRLPHVWLCHTPTGPQRPGAWLETLRSRGQLLCSYLGAGTGPPAPLYHLAAFQHPRRLLLALLQETARAENQSLEQLCLSPQVLQSSVSHPSHSHRSGLLLGGLELRNARWNKDMARLQAVHSTQPCPLPLVWVQALRKASQLPGAGAFLPRHRCPIYVGLAQQPTCLKSHRAVLHLELPCAMPPALCTQHRLHIVSLLP
ncbi:PREDICTED: dynein heavy chain domain-containing protein 1, partial [Gavialis gangeticus]|uniref:dynein heavy chain domain-containing protein 1 n=1 Tax=Gavialis gangeticus TaxID=94835 RepID=UPI00092F814B